MRGTSALLGYYVIQFVQSGKAGIYEGYLIDISANFSYLCKGR